MSTSYQVSVVESGPQTVLQLRRTIRADHAGDDIGSGMSALYAFAAATGLTASGPPSTTYHGDFLPGITIEVDFALPVGASDPSGTGEEPAIRATEPGWYARTVHRGGYQTITHAYRALEAWLGAAKYRPIGPPTEVYLVAPEQAVTAHDLVTEIRIPVTPTDLSVTVAASVADTVPLVREALIEHGFRVLNELDVCATAAARNRWQIEDYVILGACDPELIAAALSIDRRIGLMMGCTLLVRAEGDYSVVEAAEPCTAVEQSQRAAWEPIARQIRRSLAAVLARVHASLPTG